MTTPFKSSQIVKWLLYLTIIFVLFLLIFFLSNIIIGAIYENKFLRGTSIAGVDVSGLTLETAKAKVDQRLDFVQRRGFVYVSSLKTVTIYPTLQAVDSPDTSYELVRWDVDGTLNYVLDAEQTKNPLALWSKLDTLVRGKNFPLGYYWQQQRQEEILRQNFSDVLTARQEAAFVWENDKIKIIPEQPGQVLDYRQALADSEEIIKNLGNSDIKLTIIKDRPIVTAAMIEKLKSQIETTAQRGDLQIIFNEDKWLVPQSEWRNWLTIKSSGKQAHLGFAPEVVQPYFAANNIISSIERPVQEAKFQLDGNRVTEFIASRNGQKLDQEKNIASLDKLILSTAPWELSLQVIVVEPQTQNQEVNNLGIVELLGTGESDFRGSPPNRIHNIGVGANTLNGVLIAPGEEFSLIKALGEIDGEHGYKQELVIKGNKTIPEYGGGLCQIGTTIFRGALASGLPIVERRNHSYRVRYYEPAGMDATIYNPWPDFKFLNDTGKHILIQVRIEGTKLFFDFWGTADGRIAQTTEPVIYNIVAPPPKKIIKTTDLPVGQEKCTESAHSGADAKFTYSVQYPADKEPREQIFYSHYVPWQEVCLLGVTPEELLAEQASSTASGL